jgi:S-adenosylmethionine decarboxylase
MSCPEGLLRNHASIDYAQEITKHITYHSNAACQDIVLAPYQFEGFEGPEKKLLIKFVPCVSKGSPCLTDIKKKADLRNVSPEVWQKKVLDLAHCKIISQTSNEHFDSYVLSESSLFVYPNQVLLKTCGTTTLLYTIKPILDIASQFQLEPEHVMYSRKNFIFPHLQPSPHKSFQEEVEYLDSYFAPFGNGQIVGPLKGDHWYLYMAQLKPINKKRQVVPEQIVEIMMHDLDHEKMQQFVKNDNNKFLSSFDITRKAGIADILPGSVIDAFQFEPCGYSMNGLLDQFYSTIHITPEAHCSFVSYETNCNDKRSLNDLVSHVSDVFKPGRMTVTVMSRNTSPSVIELNNDGLTMKQKCTYEFQGGYMLQFLYFEAICKQQGQATHICEECMSSVGSDANSDSETDSDEWRD